MKIRVAKSTGKILGALRLSDDVFEKLQKLADKEGVSKQEIVRAILDEVIDKVET